VAAIMPWNFPMWQLARFASPSLSAGNTAVFKPSSVTTKSGINLESAFNEAGLPSGVFKTLIGDSRIADQMIDDPGTDAVTFTGSVAIGSKDADLEIAAAGAVAGRFICNGQSCIAAKRFIAEKEIAEEFTEKFIAKVKKLKVGDPLNADTDIGPMVREGALKEIEKQVQDSVKMGAKVEVGGHRIDRKGYFYEPTILTNVTLQMPVMKEE